ncbi:hypothetical protein [Chitinophaga niastensis]|uniref:hypothetical protein n=1 Tax=Chitinophaga niastensis TaxID=536980 RepID=UPI001FE77013
MLAATGLLEGKTCSTHWNLAANFKRLFPNIDLQPDKLITAERGIYTNGGAYSFLNLILFLVEKYFDRDTAIFCSKIFHLRALCRPDKPKPARAPGLTTQLLTC